MKNVEIDLIELNKLREHSRILNVMSIALEEFCEDDDTIIVGLYNLLQDYYFIKSEYYLNLKLKNKNS